MQASFTIWPTRVERLSNDLQFVALRVQTIRQDLCAKFYFCSW